MSECTLLQKGIIHTYGLYQKLRRIEELMHAKSMNAQSLHVGVVGKFGECRASSGVAPRPQFKSRPTGGGCSRVSEKLSMTGLWSDESSGMDSMVKGQLQLLMRAKCNVLAEWYPYLVGEFGKAIKISKIHSSRATTGCGIQVAQSLLIWRVEVK
ncbi:hypothetical protein TNCV_4300611 [Trichonephila clavipes]|nr:hypothetical protein TNCV_4300611 [Trichonephila clavipes]